MKRKHFIIALLAMLWSFSLSVNAQTDSFDGEGTSESPFIVDGLDDLKAFRDAVNGGEAYSGKYFKLASDITLTDAWAPIGNGTRSGTSYSGNSFKGTFDGDGKTISGLNITSTTDKNVAIGLFGVVDGGTVKNVNLTGVDINVANSNLAGAAIGMMLNGATAENITVSGAIVGNDGVGGIVGRLIINGTIKNCTNNASVTSSYGGIGGIVGKAYYEDGANTSTFASIEACTNTGTITAPMYVGGIVGLARANVTNCVNEGAVVGGTQTGGIVGQLMAAGTVSGNENKAKISGKNHLGGIIGDYSQSTDYTYYNVSIANNTNRGELAATEQCAAIMGCNNIDGFTAMTASGNKSYYYVDELELFGNPEDMVIDATNKFASGTLSYDEFNELIRENGIYDGTADEIVVILKDSERSYYNNKTAQFFIGATNVNITDPVETVKVTGVTFKFDDDDTSNAYTSGELQIFAKNIEFTNCTFIGTAVSPWGVSNSENAETAIFTNCTWKDLSGRYGVHQNRASNLTVTECKFENCERGIHTNSSTVASITITGNTFTGIGAGYGVLCLAENGNIANATLNITDNTAEGQVFLRQLNDSTTYAQVSEILDTEKNTYGTAYVSGSKEPTPAYVAQVGEVKYTDIQEAIKAAAPAGTVDVLADIIVDKWVMFAEKMTIGDGSLITLNINGLTINGNNKTMTVKSIESASNGGYLFYDAQNLTVKDLTINIADGYVGGIGLQQGTISNVTFNGGQYAVLPGKNGVTVSGCTFNGTKGYAVYYEDERPGIVVTGNTFNTADGKYAITMRSNEQFTNNTIVTGRVNLANSATSTVTGNDFGEERFKVYNGATATISNNKINNLVFSETTAPAASTFVSDNILSEEAQAAIAALPVMAGDGTEANPYTISNLTQLKAFRDDVNAGNNYQGKFVKLTADIDLNNEEWTPIGNVIYDSKYKPADASKVFSGVFNGNDKVISNLKVASTVGGVDTQANVGLFGITGEGAVIKDLTLTNVNIETDGRNVGALAGFAYKATLSNITVNGDIQIKGGNNVAGVAGMTRYYDMSATNISVSGANGSAIVGNNIVGGIFAEIAPNGSEQTFKGLNVENVAITGVGGVGGIVGLLTTGAVENVSVKNVALTGRTDYQGNAMGRIRLGSVAGLMGGKYATIANEVIDNVTAKNLDGNAVELPVIGANYDAASNATEAKIGNTYYNTLLTAVNEAKEGETITMIADVELTETVTVPAGANITLDLNGKTISMSDESGATAALIKNNGTLTIDDSSEAKDGKLTFNSTTPSAANAYASNVISNYGTITIKAGTVENTTIGGACYALDNYAGSNATIEGGKLSAEKTTVRIFNWTNGDAAKATLNVNGGEIYSKDGYAINVNSGNAPSVALNITGGTITTDDTDYNLAVYVFINTDGNAENFTANVTGGTFNGNFALNGTTSTTMKENAVSISGGTFDGVICYDEPAYGFISGGTFGEDVADYCAEGFACTPNEDGTYGVAVKVRPEYIEITINQYGSGTYCSEWALDFTNVEGNDDAFKAYAATGYNSDSGIVTMTRQNTARPKTGLFIKGTPNETYTIPVLESTDDYTMNMLVGTLEQTTLTATSSDGKYANLVYKVKDGVLMFVRAVDNQSSSRANGAYLQIPIELVGSASSAKGAKMVFDDEETTGINEIEINGLDGTVYDLQGRRVVNPAKGMYIINGKKVFIK